jgi:hypothetical protein
LARFESRCGETESQLKVDRRAVLFCRTLILDGSASIPGIKKAALGGGFSVEEAG